MSKPFPSPVRFIISSSAAVRGAAKPLAFAKITESRSFWTCNSGPTSTSRFNAWIPSPRGPAARASWADHSSGTLLAKAIMRPRTSSFCDRPVPPDAAALAFTRSAERNSSPFSASSSTLLVPSNWLYPSAVEIGRASDRGYSNPAWTSYFPSPPDSNP